MTLKEIIILIILTCISILIFPYTLKLSNLIVDSLYDGLKDWITDTVNSYKEDWKECIETIKRLVGKK